MHVNREIRGTSANDKDLSERLSRQISALAHISRMCNLHQLSHHHFLIEATGNSIVVTNPNRPD
jgi:hypothetical protein